MSKVTVKIHKKTGAFELEVNGIKGESCRSVTDFIAQHADIYAEEDTEEMWEIEEIPETIENM